MTPLSLRESQSAYEERARLLGIRSPHLPGYSCCDDWIQWQRNNHPLFGLCFRFRENPISILKRIMVLIGSLAFGVFMSNIVFLFFHLLKNADGSPKENMDVEHFESYLYQYMLVICTLGALVHSLIDLIFLRLTACSCCGTFAWCFSICLSFIFIALAAITTIQTVAPEVLEMFIGQIMNAALKPQQILLVYFVEFASAYLVFFPLMFTIIFIGAFRPCFRFEIEREKAVAIQGGSERIFSHTSNGLPLTLR